MAAPSNTVRVGTQRCFSERAPVTQYATPLKYLHWAMGGGVISALALTWVAKKADPATKAALMRYHEQIGLLVIGALVPRVAIRLMQKAPAHLPGRVHEVFAGKAVHGLMYAGMAFVPITGIMMMYFNGNALPFIGFDIPGKSVVTDADSGLAKQSAGLHVQIGSLFEILVPLHIGAVGYHLVTHNKNPLPRMATESMMAAAETVGTAAKQRPGALAAGTLLAIPAGLWLFSSLLPYVLPDESAGPMVAARPAGAAEVEYAMEEIEKHNTPDDLWIAVDGDVYDMSKYHKLHPGHGGPAIIIKNAGQDATKAFKDAKHSPNAMDIKNGLKIGIVLRNIDSELKKVLNCDDMRTRARSILKEGALAYYDAGAEDNTSRMEAMECWDRDWRLRPRNFIDVSNVDLSAEVLGHRLSVPIMAAPTALLKMGHEDGEAAVARGCAATGAGNCLSTTASLSIEDVADASPDCYRWFQLYVYKDHDKTRRLVQRAEKNGYKAICLTVDLPVLGNRTSLKRIGFKVPKEFKMANVVGEKETAKDREVEKQTGVSLKDPGDRAAYVAKLYDQSLTLELLTWLGEMTTLPIVIKGVLRGDTAAIAANHPSVRGIIVSNHGGRQLDNCIAPLTALPDVVKRVDECNIERKKKGLKPVEVYVDGGIDRGRDIFKALALGARAVLVGRPMIYGMAVGGDKGVARTVEILRDELKTVMQLAGAQTTEQIDRSFVARHGVDDTVAQNWSK